MDILAKDDLIKRAGDLKVLPMVARKLIETLSDDRCDTSSMSEIIEKDQTITARVLKISNSSLYGLRQEVISMQHAVFVLGFKTIRSLVLSISTRSLYKKFGMTEQMMWDHSVGAAIAARMISMGLGKDMEDIAFTGGLMHDLGKVIMNNETPESFAGVMMNMYNEGLDSITAEEEVYGYNHTEVGSKVIAKWGLSHALIGILEKHHLKYGTLEEIREPLIAKGVACVNLADHVCKRLGIGFRNPDETILLHELPSAVFLKMRKDRLEQMVEEISETFNTEKSVFG
jgi:putative nucleotidyltransferase with HDIG domain